MLLLLLEMEELIHGQLRKKHDLPQIRSISLERCRSAITKVSLSTLIRYKIRCRKIETNDSMIIVLLIDFLLS